MLILDDWELPQLENYGREDQLEIFDDGAERRATIITRSCRSSIGTAGSARR